MQNVSKYSCGDARKLLYNFSARYILHLLDLLDLSHLLHLLRFLHLLQCEGINYRRVVTFERSNSYYLIAHSISHDAGIERD